MDLVSELSPLETLRVAQSPFAKVVKTATTWGSCSASSTCGKRGARGAMSVAPGGQSGHQSGRPDPYAPKAMG